MLGGSRCPLLQESVALGIDRSSRTVLTLLALFIGMGPTLRMKTPCTRRSRAVRLAVHDFRTNFGILTPRQVAQNNQFQKKRNKFPKLFSGTTYQAHLLRLGVFYNEKVVMGATAVCVARSSTAEAWGDNGISNSMDNEDRMSSCRMRNILSRETHTTARNVITGARKRDVNHEELFDLAELDSTKLRVSNTFCRFVSRGDAYMLTFDGGVTPVAQSKSSQRMRLVSGAGPKMFSGAGAVLSRIRSGPSVETSLVAIAAQGQVGFLSEDHKRGQWRWHLFLEGQSTPQQVEYAALILGLRGALDNWKFYNPIPSALLVLGDNLYVIRHLRAALNASKSQPSAPHIADPSSHKAKINVLRRKALALIEQIPVPVEVLWLPRGFNEAADCVAQDSRDERRSDYELSPELRQALVVAPTRKTGNLRASGFTAAELKARGCKAKELKVAGFTSGELKGAGFTPKNLKNAGFAASELKALGITTAELKAAGFTLRKLNPRDFTASELKAAGFTASELEAAGFVL